MPIAAIVLAAGASTRLGEPKQLIELGGIPLVRRAAIAAHDAGALRVFVVLGSQAELISPALAGLDDVTTVINTRWSDGLASSLAAGLSSVAAYPDIDGALITLADQPRADSSALLRIVVGFDSHHRIVASAYSNVLGVPALIGREYFSDLMQLEGDRGAGQWLRSRKSDVVAIPFAAPMLDIDSPEDVAQLMAEDSFTTGPS